MVNTGDTGDEQIKVDWPEPGLSRDCAVRDLWAKEDLGVVTGGRTFAVAPHASGIYKITASRELIAQAGWSNAPPKKR